LTAGYYYSLKMAWRMKLSLPKFRVTQIGETKIHRNLPRGRKTAGSVCGVRPDSVSSDDEHDDKEMELPPDGNDEAGPSLHAIKQKASAAAWSQVRATLQKAAIESSALPCDQGCILCGAPATHRCTSCGAWAYYCIDCFRQAHSLTNFFHVGEVWEEGVFRPIAILNEVIDVRIKHSCSSSYSLPLCCLDENGDFRIIY
jgi:hypothetical protein